MWLLLRASTVHRLREGHMNLHLTSVAVQLGGADWFACRASQQNSSE